MEIPDWGALYAEYHPGLRAYIYGRLSDPELADDLAAEVFVKGMADYAKGKGSRSHLKGWLYKIAHNLIIDTYRKRTRIGPALDLEDFTNMGERGITLADLIESKVMGERVERAIMRLTEGQIVAILAHYQGYSAQEIGAMLEREEGAAKALLHRARVQLRIVLADLRRAKRAKSK